MIEQLRAVAARLDRLEASLQRPTQELRDSGDLRLRIGRQPDDTWTVRAHNPGGDVLADLLGLGPVETSLPGSPTAGQVVRYRHTAGVAPWLCIWDPALNSGSGAWAVIGAAPLTATQGGGASGSSAAINTWAALPNTPQISVPAGGVYVVSAAGNLSSESAGAKQARVRVWTGAAGSRVIGSLLASGAGQSSSPGSAPVSLTVAGGTTLSLQMCTDNTTVTFGAAAELWSLTATPIELRP